MSFIHGIKIYTTKINSPWKLIKPDVNTSLSEFKKNNTNHLELKQNLAEFKHSKQPTIDIYTDGLKGRK